MSKPVKHSTGDRVFEVFNIVFFAIILFIVIYPLYFIIISSFSDPTKVMNGEVWFWIKGFNFEGYARIFESEQIWTGYRNSIIYTVAGTALNVILTMMLAYTLAQKTFPARNILMILVIIPMFVSGGLIPTYLLVDNLNLVGKWPLMVILGAVTPWNVIIARTFLQAGWVKELQESSYIDGCSDFRFFLNIVMPLSKALIAILCLYYGLWHWNGYFDALIYLKDPKTFPLQLILRDILIVATQQGQFVMNEVEDLAERQRVAEIIKYGVIIVASVPMLVIYPFLQKYFVKGVMIGSLKG